LEKLESEPERLEENAQTIRPNRSPSSVNASLAKPPPAKINSIIEDYSDIGGEDELEEKVADFKVILPFL